MVDLDSNAWIQLTEFSGGGTPFFPYVLLVQIVHITQNLSQRLIL